MEQRIASSTSKHSWKVNTEESQEKRDTHGEHSLMRDKVRGKWHSLTESTL